MCKVGTVEFRYTFGVYGSHDTQRPPRDTGTGTVSIYFLEIGTM
jgi:hypothetical protein